NSLAKASLGPSLRRDNGDDHNGVDCRTAGFFQKRGKAAIHSVSWAVSAADPETVAQISRRERLLLTGAAVAAPPSTAMITKIRFEIDNNLSGE
ncbi:MAG: hypothetical protein MUE84_11245, partial [Hyphomonas sp.]|nr:hypothetical protein [Hyphomonas sp.]